MTIHIDGFAFRGPEQKQAHQDAWEKVKHIEGAILRKRGGYASMTIELDPAKVEGLSPLEKLVLADQMPSPFGGRLESPTRVVVYTD